MSTGQPYLGFFLKCQHYDNHVWTLISATRLRATSGLLKVPSGWEPHLDFESASRLEATSEL